MLGWWDSIEKATLNSGMSLTDLGRGIIITTNSVTAGTANVTVKFTVPQCVHKNPQIQSINYPYWQIPTGQYIYVDVNLMNGDYYGCDPETFRSIITVPSPLSIASSYPENGQSILAPEEQGWYSVSIFIPDETPTGEYTAEYNLTNITDGSTVSLDFPLRVCALSDCTQ